MDPLPFLALPAGAEKLATLELTDGGDLKLVRSELHRFFAGLDEVAERVALVATELAGNALRHGLPPVVVRLFRDEGCYLLDVSDQDPHGVPESTTRRHPTTAGGRGLLIARALTEQLCWYNDGKSKHVWASFPADVAPSC